MTKADITKFINIALIKPIFKIYLLLKINNNFKKN